MSYTLLDETFPKARKPHRCIWCGESIEVGETYMHEKSVFHGNFQNHKWHLECDKASKEEQDEPGCQWFFDPHENERPVKESEE